FNFLMFFLAKWLLPLLKIEKGTPAYRTYMMLIPSLAPGLSCFPFVIEYLGDETLAQAALADVGNKIFVLIILYLIAMKWYYQLKESNGEEKGTEESRLKGLLKSLISEPVNLVIVSAIILLAFGLNMSALPVFFQDTVTKMSALMTPMVLLFIGMAVKFNRQQFSKIFQLLLFRSGLAFVFSALVLTFVPVSSSMAMLILIFPQSAASFWPFAHMSAVTSLQANNKEQSTVFQLDLGLNFLALSLPFSTLLILVICSTGSSFANTWVAWLAGLSMLGIVIVPLLLRGIAKRKKEEKRALAPV
ncbi:MAG: permease, partial [Bacteroidota bacterium]